MQVETNEGEEKMKKNRIIKEETERGREKELWKIKHEKLWRKKSKAVCSVESEASDGEKERVIKREK